MNNRKNEKLTVTFKKYITRVNKTSNETIKNSIKDLNRILNRLRSLQSKINKCSSIEELNNNNELGVISNDIGLITSNSYIIEDLSFKKRLDEVNYFYREIEELYFNKKIEILNSKLDENYKKTNENLKEVTGNTLFSIATVFLGISLTSALVSGLQFIEKQFIPLYFMTCMLIAVIVIGLAAIFMRKFDIKSFAIMIVIIIVSALWFQTFKYYENININEGNKNNENVNVNEGNENNKVVNMDT